MPLYTVAAGNTIRSQDVDQMVQLLTGQMPDQPVTIGSNFSVGGNVAAIKLTAQTLTPTVTQVGATGTTRYDYQIAPVNAGGDGYPSLSGTITTGNATLSGTVYNVVTWPRVAGATSYRVLVSLNLGAFQQITTVNDPGGGGTTATYNDVGAARSAYTATTAPPGGFVQASANNAGTSRFVGLVPAGGPAFVGGIGGWANGDFGIDSAGRVWIYNGTVWRPAGAGTAAFAAYSSASQSVTSGATVNIDTPEYDPAGNFYAAGHYWYAPIAGWYCVQANIYFNNQANLQAFGEVRMGGAPKFNLSSVSTPGGGGFGQSAGAGVFYATVGANITLGISYASAACTLAGGSNGTRMSGFLVGV